MRALRSLLQRRGLRADTFLLIRSATCILTILLVWLGWSLAGSARAVHAAAQEAVRVAELRGQIAYLDEYLTASVRMAAASGDRHWVERFEDAEPTLDAAVRSAALLGSPRVREGLSETVIEAQRNLRQMQHRALTLAMEGPSAEAQALLDSVEFGYLQAVAVSGMDAFGQDLKRDVDERAGTIGAHTWLRALGFGLTAILLVMSIMAAQHRIRLRVVDSVDALTQLPNRRRFCAQLARRLEAGSLGNGEHRALLLVAIDRFKAVNDSYGHAVADGLLQCVAARLEAFVPPRSLLARVGGDEFAVLIETPPSDIDHNGPTRRILAGLAEPYRLEDGTEMPFSLSAGVAWLVMEQSDIRDAMRQADAALRQAKRDGRGCLREFDLAMEVTSRDRTKLEADLRQAIEQDVIVPFFQPLVDLRTGQIIGVEALARWRHAERGWVSPADFIPLAEDLGLVGALTERLLRRCCTATLAWPAHVTVAFNVSPLQLRDDSLPGLVRTILDETGFPACRLELEVTESALVTDLALARRLLENLRRNGVRLALDDFGTGYSSLKHLRCLPFDKIKIDASFVSEMMEKDESGKIVAAVVGLGRSLGLSTVAEGVETQDVAAFLRELGCDIGQGWHFGRPAPAEELALRFGETAAVRLVA